MSLAVRNTASQNERPASAERVGDRVAALAAEYAARMNASPFARDLRDHRVDRRRYITYLAVMYPVVVGFNRALIHGIAKVDHVRNASFVKVLAEQLQEEQAHNQLWRAKLELFGVDHEALYSDMTDYLARYSVAELDELTRAVLRDVKADGGTGTGRRFAEAIFPDSVLALYHHLWMTASQAAISHWEHFASQAGIEMVIWDVVTASILPGVYGHPDLDAGERSTHWWREHGRVPGMDASVRTDEEKHLELSRIALNRSDVANGSADQVVARAEDAMRLFAATMLGFDDAAARFPLDDYIAARR